MTKAEIKKLVDELQDLHEQATKERSHHYVGSCCQMFAAALLQLLMEIEGKDAALEIIGKQALRKEMRGNDAIHADWENGYELCVLTARTAMSSKEGR